MGFALLTLQEVFEELAEREFVFNKESIAFDNAVKNGTRQELNRRAFGRGV